MEMESYHNSLQHLESDIQLANSLAATIPRAKGCERIHIKLVYNQWAPLYLFLLQWIDSSCKSFIPGYLNLFHILVYKSHADRSPTISKHGRKATVREFYAVILPSLQRLQNVDDFKGGCPAIGSFSKGRVAGSKCHLPVDFEREDECGICLEACPKVVLPICCHAMCIKCFRKWNLRSESCPFCRGSIKRVNSEDLWVLTSNDDVVDTETVSKEDLLRLYLYINGLPKDYPDALFFVYYEYLM